MLVDLYNRIGFSLCHQISSRTFFIDGVKLPVCARDTGIYLGFIITFAFIFVFYKNSSDLPPRRILILGGLSIFILALDGISSYAGLRQTTNVLRLTTGVPVGSFIALLLSTAFNESRDIDIGKLNKKILEKSQHQIFLAFILLVLFFVVISEFSFLKYILPTLIVFSILFAFFILNLTILNLSRLRTTNKYILAMALVVAELSLTSYIHSLFIKIST